MAIPDEMELNASKLIQRLSVESKDDRIMLVLEIEEFLEHMKSVGKKHSMAYRVLSQARETVDLEIILDAIENRAVDMESTPNLDRNEMVEHDVYASGHNLVGPSSSRHDVYASGHKLVGPSSSRHDSDLESVSDVSYSKLVTAAMRAVLSRLLLWNPDSTEENTEVGSSSTIGRLEMKSTQPSSLPQQSVMEIDNANGSNPFEFQEDDASGGTKKKGALARKYGIRRSDLEQHYGMNLDDVAVHFGVSKSTLKRICRDLNIFRWRPCKPKNSNAHQELLQSTKGDTKESRLKTQPFSDLPRKLDLVPKSTTMLDASTQDHSCIMIKATYKDDLIKFQLPLSSGKMDLEIEIAKRLKLPIGSFKLKYIDEDDDWVLITCDEDLITCVRMLRFLGNNTIRMFVTQITH